MSLEQHVNRLPYFATSRFRINPRINFLSPDVLLLVKPMRHMPIDIFPIKILLISKLLISGPEASMCPGLLYKALWCDVRKRRTHVHVTVKLIYIKNDLIYKELFFFIYFFLFTTLLENIMSV